MALFAKSAFPAAIEEEVGALATEFEALFVADGARIQRFKDYRKENERSRDADIFGQVADLQDYGAQRTSAEPSRHNIPLPFGLALTIKHGFRIFGRLPDIVVDRRMETERERYRSDTMEKLVWAIIRAAGGETLFKDAAWDGSQLGASCFDIYWDPKRQMPIPRVIDPTGIVCVKGLENPHEFQRVYRAWTVDAFSLRAEYANATFRGIPIPFETLSNREVTLVQVTDKRRTLRFVVDGLIGNDNSRVLPLYEKEHNLGFVNYVVIPNIGPERELWGWADYELVRGLVHYIPTLFSREADLLRAASGGAYIEKGTGQKPDRIIGIIRKGGVIPSKREGSVEPVPTPDVPDFEVEHASRGLEMLKMLGFAPDAAWGDGAAGSGSDRGLQLQPLLELTAMKQSNWSAGLNRLFSMALRMMEDKQVFSTQYSGVAQKGNRRVPFLLPSLGPDEPPATVEVGENPDGTPLEEELPRNLKELFAGEYETRFFWQNRIDPEDPAYVNSELTKFQQGAQSLRTTLERLGVQNPEDEMKLIEQEADRFPWIRQGQIALIKAELQASAQAQGQGAGGGNPGDPTAGLFEANDDFASTDTSATDGDFAAKAANAPGGPLYGRS